MIGVRDCPGHEVEHWGWLEICLNSLGEHLIAEFVDMETDVELFMDGEREAIRQTGSQGHGYFSFGGK